MMYIKEIATSNFKTEQKFKQQKYILLKLYEENVFFSH